jgi:2-polyprenyl-3-methyl-5-hydroxy-6-metoxy-1,4-benzoquinol methylase
MIPSRSMIFVSPRDFEKVGQEFKNYFIKLVNSQPSYRILDVCCGIGHMAIPLQIIDLGMENIGALI